MIGFGQEWSNYYINANVNHNINKKVNVSGHINKTITTIDFGALAQANALNEQNRIENIKYVNERERQESYEIAADPSKAFDYGTDNDWRLPRKVKKMFGWDKKLKTFYHKIPHKSLFYSSGNEGYSYENISSEGIKTQLTIDVVQSLEKLEENESAWNDDIDLEEYLQYENWIIGLDLATGIFCHKKEIKRKKVGPISGYCGTLVYEDKYEKIILDEYFSIGEFKGKKYRYFTKVKFIGDKTELSFEQIEGRRYYLRNCIEKIISTLNMTY